MAPAALPHEGEQPTDSTDDGQRKIVLAALVRSVLLTAAIMGAYIVLPLDDLARLSPFVTLPAALVAFVAVLVVQLRAIGRSRHPGVRAVEALAFAVPMLMVIFAATYYVMGVTDPSSFSEGLSKLDALYFTITVFATVGFGDIVAKSQPARAAVTLQMVVNLLVIGVGLRVILGTVQAARERAGRPLPGIGR